MKINKKIIIGIVIAMVIILGIIIFLILKNRKVTKVEIGGQIIDIVESGDGLYSDGYIDNRYIYRGKNPNNYIKFNDELWRIVSVDKDGNIQIMKDDVLDARAFDSKGFRDVNSEKDGGSYCKDANDGCNAWTVNENIVGKPKNFVNGNFKGEVKIESEMLTYLNNDYFKTINDSNYIINHNWFIGGADGEVTLNVQTDTETSAEWNGKVGLITASDYIKATTGKNCNSIDSMNYHFVSCGESNWMYKEGSNWWTITPLDNASIQLWYIGDGGFINMDSASKEFGVRPSLYLSDEVELNGDGSSDNPFIIKK